MANCPICRGEFDVGNIGGVTVAVCEKCDGTWLAAGDLDRLSQQKLEQNFDSWMEAPTECRHCQTPLGFSDECVRCHKAPTIQCPRGHGVMNATLIELGTREFEIDHCPSCRGIWIDGHEREHLDAADERPPAPRHRVEQVSGTPRGSYKGASFLSSLDRIESSQSRAFSAGLVGFSPNERPEPGAVIAIALIGAVALGLIYFFVAPVLAGF